MKLVLSAALFLFLFVSAFAETHSFDDAYIAAGEGDAAKILEIVDSFSDDDLTAEQIKEKNRFHRRFRSSDDIAYTGESMLVNDIMTFFHVYWDKVLLQKASGDQALNELVMNVIPYLHENYLKESGITIEDLQNSENLRKHLSDLLLKDGYHSRIGQTGHIMDIFMWKQEDRQTCSVELPENNIDVTVVFMKDFVTLGWSEYATLGKYTVGGWAVDAEMFCPNHQYDRHSEYFLVNFLTHEAQHCSDYKTYPKLKQTDLEYRAKLAELSKAQETVYDIIGRFINSQSLNRDSAHAFSNHCIVRELSEIIFESGLVENIEKWKEIPAETINATAVKLLARHTENLTNSGSMEVSQFIQ